MYGIYVISAALEKCDKLSEKCTAILSRNEHVLNEIVRLQTRIVELPSTHPDLPDGVAENFSSPNESRVDRERVVQAAGSNTDNKALERSQPCLSQDGEAGVIERRHLDHSLPVLAGLTSLRNLIASMSRTVLHIEEFVSNDNEPGNRTGDRILVVREGETPG